jgi:hypothetical protein
LTPRRFAACNASFVRWLIILPSASATTAMMPTSAAKRPVPFRGVVVTLVLASPTFIEDLDE